MKRNWIILIAVAAAVIAVLAGRGQGSGGNAPEASASQPAEQRQGSENGDDPAKPKAGSKAPAFELPVMDGSSTYRVGGQRDKVLIVNFWASWCGPCDLEAPDLVALNEKYKDKVDLYAVNATNNDRLRDARGFVKEKGFTFPVLTDDKGTAGNAYKVFAYPTSFIVGKDGRIVQRIEGTIPLAQWEKYLDEATRT